MAKANYDKGLLTAVDNIDAFTEVTAPNDIRVLQCDELFSWLMISRLWLSIILV